MPVWLCLGHLQTALWKHVIEGSGSGWKSVGGRERVERWWEVGTMKPAEVFPGLLWLFFLEKQTLQIVKKNTVEAQQSIFGYY